MATAANISNVVTLIVIDFNESKSNENPLTFSDSLTVALSTPPSNANDSIRFALLTPPRPPPRDPEELDRPQIPLIQTWEPLQSPSLEHPPSDDPEDPPLELGRPQVPLLQT